VISAAANKIFQRLCALLECEPVAAEPRFATNHDRVRNRDALIPQLSALTIKRTTGEWLRALEDADIPCAPVNDLRTAYQELGKNSPGMVREVLHPTLGSIHQLGIPFKFGACDTDIKRPPPMLGEHTEEILLNVLNRDSLGIDLLREKGAI